MHWMPGQGPEMLSCPEEDIKKPCWRAFGEVDYHLTHYRYTSNT